MLGEVHQDMLLEHLLMSIAADEHLGAVLALNGGTCLHKLWLPAPKRYSEDLDYVLLGEHDTRDVMRHIQRIGQSIGLEIPQRTRMRLKPEYPKVFFYFDDIDHVRRRLTIHMLPTAEQHMKEAATRILKTVSETWCGELSSDVQTMTAKYMAATKLAALFSRRKGRDLMDFVIYAQQFGVLPSEAADHFERFKRHDKRMRRWTAVTARRGLAAHLENVLFLDDLRKVALEWATPGNLAAAQQTHSAFAGRVHDELLRRKQARRERTRQLNAAFETGVKRTEPVAYQGTKRGGPRCGRELPRGGGCERRRNHPGRCRKQP